MQLAEDNFVESVWVSPSIFIYMNSSTQIQVDKPMQ